MQNGPQRRMLPAKALAISRPMRAMKNMVGERTGAEVLAYRLTV